MRTNLGMKAGNPDTDVNRRLTALETGLQQIPGRPMVLQNVNAVSDQYIVQSAHGFSFGTIIFWNGTAWKRSCTSGLK